MRINVALGELATFEIVAGEECVDAWQQSRPTSTLR
jgi:hypothetical protein